MGAPLELGVPIVIVNKQLACKAVESLTSRFLGALPFTITIGTPNRAHQPPDSVAERHDQQGARLAAACERLQEGDTWTRVRGTLTPMVPGAAWVEDVLRQAGAAHRVQDLGIDRERFLWAVHNGGQIRERFTSLDLAWATGVLPGAAEEIVAGLC